MPGLIDKFAPDVASEYLRFLDLDILGKMLFKNFLIHRIGLAETDIYVPRSRSSRGDIEHEERLPADARITTAQGHLNVEVKAARINVANRSRDVPNENFQFVGCLETRDTKSTREFDLMVAICVRVPGLEDPGYWAYLTRQEQRLKEFRASFSATTRPHEPDYLNVCGFFVIPRNAIKTTTVRATILSSRTPRCPYWGYFAWGYDHEACRSKWQAALRSLPR